LATKNNFCAENPEKAVGGLGVGTAAFMGLRGARKRPDSSWTKKQFGEPVPFCPGHFLPRPRGHRRKTERRAGWKYVLRFGEIQVTLPKIHRHGHGLFWWFWTQPGAGWVPARRGVVLGQIPLHGRERLRALGERSLQVNTTRDPMGQIQARAWAVRNRRGGPGFFLGGVGAVTVGGVEQLLTSYAAALCPSTMPPGWAGPLKPGPLVYFVARLWLEAKQNVYQPPD